jgi:hypothetical protein
MFFSLKVIRGDGPVGLVAEVTPTARGFSSRSAARTEIEAASNPLLVVSLQNGDRR